MVSRALGSSLLFSVSLFSLIANLASSETDMPTTCYVIDGKHNGNAGFRCNNQTSGHSSCCGIGGICYSNGVCQQANGDVQDYLRVGCTDPTWQDPACLDQCTIYATSSTAGIRFCNGSITSTTQYCCDNGEFGVGSFACCSDPSDIFAISPAATYVAQIPLSQISTSSSTSAASTSTTSSSTTSSTTSSSTTSSSSVSAITTSPAATTSAAASSSSSHAAAIGAGVGVPVGIVALAGIGYLLWRRRRNAKRHAFVNQYETGRRPHTDNYTQSQGPPPQEAPGSMPMGENGSTKAYFGGREYRPTPQEMPTPNLIHEMPAGR